MDADCYTFIFSLIFGFFLVFAGMLFRRVKYGIPFRESLRMLWQEGIVDGFKEFRTNFIPVTKKAINILWIWFKKGFAAIAAKRSVQEKHSFTPDLYCGLYAVAANYTYKYLLTVIRYFYFPLPSYIKVSFYSKDAITDDIEAEIVWALTAVFQEYMDAYRLNFLFQAFPYVKGNRIEVDIYYCESQTEYPAYQDKCDKIMQMRSAPAFKPLTEADLPKTSDLVLGYRYEKWTTTGQVVPIIWDVSRAPHIMVSGPTSGGKSVYIKILLSQILATGASVCLCDYKGQSDYRELVKDCSIGAECDARLTQFCADFEKARELGEEDGWKILVFDEFGSFAASKEKKEWEKLMKTISNVVFMGRSYKYSIVLISQRFDADTIKTSLREQFSVKVYMGPTISQQSATMLFPNSDLDKSTRLPPCCGYISTPKTDLDTIILPKVDIPALDRRLKALGENTQE